ncbi:hypothetical protein BCV70DRAFT_199511 [Testicularia cyperi]|uniref:NADH dehydrogenase [ubiquinone] 1 beta subcomplex subunit 4 n=1 Tax=Testicularia cyperi TaxID=1882483 RepID=A0A317XS62_9BASI|nr:hypothetical protein BCV70DRAFT_199511 [Testicularia cyperi]
MAGGNYHPFKADPALDRWQNLHSTMYQRFRMTPANTRAVLLWGLTVPVLTYYAASYTNDRWDLRGKTREDSLLTKPPAAAQPAEDDE